MRKLQQFILFDCVAFTVLALVYSLLELTSIVTPFTSTDILQFFLVTSIIALLQVILGSVWQDREHLAPFYVLMRLLAVLVPVFLVGGLIARWFPPTLLYSILVVGICIVVFVVVYAASLVHNYVSSSKINAIIRRRKAAKGEQHEKRD